MKGFNYRLHSVIAGIIGEKRLIKIYRKKVLKTQLKLSVQQEKLKFYEYRNMVVDEISRSL